MISDKACHILTTLNSMTTSLQKKKKVIHVSFILLGLNNPFLFAFGFGKRYCLMLASFC